MDEHTYAELLDAMRGFPAFALTFAMLMVVIIFGPGFVAVYLAFAALCGTCPDTTSSVSAKPNTTSLTASIRFMSRPRRRNSRRGEGVATLSFIEPCA